MLPARRESGFAFRVLPVFVSVLFLTGCAYDPPVVADHTSDTYRNDLAQCRQTVDAKVDLVNRSTFPAFVISPFTGPPRKRADVRDCMVAKGYRLAQP